MARSTKLYQSRVGPGQLRDANRGTTIVLLIDFIATMGVTTAGVLYLRTSPLYLLLLAMVTFVLFFVISGLLSLSDLDLGPKKSRQDS